MVDIVIHEIGAPLGKINRQLDLIEREVAALEDQEAVARIGRMLVSIKAWSEQIHNLRQRLDPQTAGRRSRVSAFDVRQELDDNFHLYGAVIESQGITWEIEAPDEPIKVRMARAALGQVVANLIDNSVYWLVRSKGSAGGGRILAKLARLDHGFSVTVSDDGVGVAEPDRLEIFEPYFSRKPNGIGLGLYIARLVIEPYGRLVYRTDCELPGACFEATFEHNVGL